MGVHGLWQLLQSTGHPVSLESLAGKVLGIDVSMWLHQASKGMRDRHGNAVANAHLVVLFRRICKLLYYHIKPVFVFDGGVPLLKKQTLSQRRRQRDNATNDADLTTKKLISKLLQKQAVNLALNNTSKDSESCSSSQSQPLESDIFHLQPLPEHLSAALSEAEQQSTWERRMEQQGAIFSNFEDIAQINTESEDFALLPAEIKHELLTEMKDHSRRNRWAKASEMPEDCDEFSKYQLNRLMKQSRLTQHLNKVRKELTAKASGDIAMDVVGSEVQGLTVEASRVLSEDSSHYFLIKGLRQLQDALSKTDDSDHGNQSDDVKPVVSESFKRLDHTAVDDGGELDWDGEAVGPFQDVPCAKEFQACKHADESIDLSDQETSSDEEDSNSFSDHNNKKMPLVINNENELKFDVDSKCQDISDNESGKDVTETVEEMSARLFSFSENVVNESDDSTTSTKIFKSDEPSLQTSTNILTLPQPMVSEEEKCVAAVEINESDSSDDEGFIEVEPEPAFDSQAVIPNEEIISYSELNSLEHNAGQSADVRVEDQKEPIPSQVFEDITQGELWKIQETLEHETQSLRQERGKHERLATSITDQMQVEAQELLRLFGVPYIISPMEAEAQCAFLDATDQTQGTVTDDSDIWLFGGRNVYRNMFNQNRDVELYNLVDIKSRMFLKREDFIKLALLCGSDYTEGLPGVGPVTGVEILAEFPGTGIESLIKFREWWDEAKRQAKIPQETKIKSKLRNLKLYEGFPNPAVFDAYLSPAIDDSLDPFSWSMPDLDLLRHYGMTKLNWNQNQVDELILPIMKSLNRPEIQCSIKDFYLPDSKEVKSLRSSRLRNVINRIRSKNNTETSDIGKQSKDKATKGLKTKNSKSSKGRGFVSSLKRAPSDVNLSEESSDESGEKMNAEDEFEISDEILASIDLASCMQSESSAIINNGSSTAGKKAATKSAKVKKPRKSKLC